jgi:hypothetical protein
MAILPMARGDHDNAPTRRPETNESGVKPDAGMRPITSIVPRRGFVTATALSRLEIIQI